MAGEYAPPPSPPPPPPTDWESSQSIANARPVAQPPPIQFNQPGTGAQQQLNIPDEGTPAWSDFVFNPQAATEDQGIQPDYNNNAMWESLAQRDPWLESQYKQIRDRNQKLDQERTTLQGLAAIDAHGPYAYPSRDLNYGNYGQPTRESDWLGQGIADMAFPDKGIGRQLGEKALYPSLGPRGKALLSTVTRVPTDATSEAGGYYTGSQIGINPRMKGVESNPVLLAHELTHAYEDRYMSPDDTQKFYETAMKLVAAHDPTASRVIASMARDVPGATAEGLNSYNLSDPAHVITAFVEDAFRNPGALPDALRPFLKGLFSDQFLNKPGPNKIGFNDASSAPTEQLDIATNLTPERQKQLLDEYHQRIAPIMPAVNMVQRNLGLANATVLGPNNVAPPQTQYGPTDFRPLDLLPPARGETAPSQQLQHLTTFGPQSITQIPAAINAAPGIAAEAVSGAVRSIPTGGESLGERINNAPGIVRIPANFALDAAPYVAADAATGGALTPLFVEQAGTQAAQIGSQYAQGEIDGKTALTQLALAVGPILLAPAIHTVVKAVPELAAFVSSDEGRALVTKLQSERGAAGEGPVPGEADKLGLGPPTEADPLINNSPAPETPEKGSLAQRLSAQPTTVDEAALQVSEWLRKGEKARPEQETMFAQQRAQQAAKMESVFQQGGSSQEAKAAGGGEFKRPTLSPLDLTPETEQAIRGEIASSPVFTHPGQRITANDALDAMQQGRLPQPNEAIELSKILGLPFFEQVGRASPTDWYGEALGVLGVPQALQSGLDASAIFRQMAPLGWTNPGEYFDAIGTIGRAVKSDESAFQVQRETMELPWIEKSPVAGGEGLTFNALGGRMADIGGHLQESEGQFAAINRSTASRVVEAIPGYKASERIYNVPINRLRGSVYSKWAQNMWDAGERRPKMYKAVADVVDHASGWSNLSLGQIGRGLNVFYSARNLAARFQVLLDPIVQPGSLLKPSARQLAARNLVGFAGANAALLGLMGGSGVLAGKALGIPNPVHIELDPRSGASFTGQIGKLHVDMTGGFGSIIRLVSRLAPLARGEAPQIKTPGGLIQNASFSRLADDFIAGKLGPIPAIIWHGLGFPGGESFAEDFGSVKGARTAALHLFTPLFIQDIVEAYQQEGAKGAALAGPIGFLGGGVNSYEQSAASVARDAKAAVNLKPFNEIASKQYQAVQNQLKNVNSVRAANLNPSDYSSISDFKKAYVDYWTAKLGGSALNHQTAESRYAAIPAVKTYTSQLSTKELSFWRNHANWPLLVSYIDANPSALTKELTPIYSAAKRTLQGATP